MKVYQINFSDIVGGAARAAYRIHHAVRSGGVDSEMKVVKASSGDWTVSCPTDPLFQLGTLVRPQIASFARSLLKTEERVPLSSSIFSSRWPDVINKSDADIVNLHWLCAEMMSIEDIGKIRKPIVWTMHDMWGFCGAEHYSNGTRWVEGYTAVNRPIAESGFDLNRWVWKRKFKAWKKPINIVTPSGWLADCIKKSALMADWPVTVIPNAIDTDIWQPIDRVYARKLLGVSENVKLITFGAMGGGIQPIKGFDLLLSALENLRGQCNNLEVIIFGPNRPKNEPDLGFPIHYTGHLHDDISLCVLYSAVDALVIPSRMDNLPNTGVEALSCGTPVIAFDTCGLSDIVTHQQTGWLAKAFDTEDLARGILWVLEDYERCVQLSYAARADAVARFSYPVVGSQYMSIYQNILDIQ